MARNGLAEVFDFKGTLEPRGEESAERRNEGRECCEYEDMKLHRGDMNRGGDLQRGWEWEIDKERGDMIRLMYENGVWGAGEACKYVRTKVLKIISLEE